MVLNDAPARTERVMDHLAAGVRTSAAHRAQEEQLLELVDQARTVFLADDPRNLLSVHLPVLVAQVLGGDEVQSVAEQAAAATTAVYLGARLLDDLIDADKTTLTVGTGSPWEVVAVATVLSGLGQHLLLSMPSEAIARLAALREINAAIFELAASQNVEHGGSTHDPRRLASWKSGKLMARFSAIGAAVARATPAELLEARRYGGALGTGRQLIIDLRRLPNRNEAHANAAVQLVFTIESELAVCCAAASTLSAPLGGALVELVPNLEPTLDQGG